jgi:hypothetical protein
MQQLTCTRVQPVGGCVQDALAPLCPLSGGVQYACYNMRSSSCYSMRTTARRRRGTNLYPCLPACYSVVPCSAVRARRRTVLRCRLAGESAPLARAQRARCDEPVHSCCGCRWRAQHSRVAWALRRTRAASAKHRRKRARERGLTREMRRRLLPTNSHVARLMRKCRLLPRNQVQEASSSMLQARGEEPPLPSEPCHEGNQRTNVALRQVPHTEIPLGTSPGTTRQFGQSRRCRSDQHQHQAARPQSNREETNA